MSRATSPNTRGPSAAQSDASSASLYDEIEGEAEVQAVNPGPKAICGIPRKPNTLVLSSDIGVNFPQRIEIDIGSGRALSNNSAAGLNRDLSDPSTLEDAEEQLQIACTYHHRAIRYVKLDCSLMDINVWDRLVWQTFDMPRRAFAFRLCTALSSST